MFGNPHASCYGMLSKGGHFWEVNGILSPRVIILVNLLQVKIVPS